MRESRDSSGFDAEYEFQLEEIPFSRARELRANRTPEVTVTSLATWFASGPIQRAKYKDFTSIDWIFDNHKARMRKARIKKQAKELLGKLKFYYFCSQTWIVVVTIGFMVGVIATCVSISTQWLIDLRDGYCKTGFYLNQKFCCWKTEDFCEDWSSWSEAIGLKWWVGEKFLKLVVYLSDSVLFSGISTFLVTYYAPYAAGQGMAELKTIMSGFVMRAFLGYQTLIIKSVGIALSVASGLSVGKEMAFVHIAACCGELLCGLFDNIRQNEALKREILSASTAAGISVAFGAPIAGVLFSFEVVSYYFPPRTMWSSFFCAAVAAMTLKYFDPYRNGKLVPFQNVHERTWLSFEFLFFMLLGVMGGVVGALIVKIDKKMVEYRQNTILHKFVRGEVVAVAFITAIVCHINPFAKADAVTLVSNLFTECLVTDTSGLCDYNKIGTNITSLLLSFFLRIIFTSVSCGLAVPTGVFLPTMAIGASIGRALGLGIEHMHRTHPEWLIFQSCSAEVRCITPAVYALVGAAAVLSGTTRMSMTVVVIMFEVTGALVYVLPLMVAVTISKWVASYIEREGIFESAIEMHKYPFLAKEKKYRVSGTAKGIMTAVHELVFIDGSKQTLERIERMVGGRDIGGSDGRYYQGYPVVKDTEGMEILGYINSKDLRLGVETSERNIREIAEVDKRIKCYFGSEESGGNEQMYLDFRPYMDTSPITVYPDTQNELVIDIFRGLGVRYVLVAKHQELMGIITKKDVLRLTKHFDAQQSQ